MNSNNETDVEPYAEPVLADELVEAATYFSLIYLDDEMLFPTLEPIVFVGKDLDPNHPGLYFQDLRSFRQGISYSSNDDNQSATFTAGSAPKHVFTYEHAMEELMRCALRRSKLSLST